MAGRRSGQIEMPGEDVLPKGPVRDLVALLHQLHRKAGRPSTRIISSEIYDNQNFSTTVAPNTVGAIMRGAQLSNYNKVEAVAIVLIERNHRSRSRLLDELDILLTTWNAAQDSINETESPETRIISAKSGAKVEQLRNQESEQETTTAIYLHQLADSSLLVPPAVFLVAIRGPEIGNRWLLDTSMPVLKAGRHPDSDIYLDDFATSRRHAELVLESDRTNWSIRDCGSVNGTYLNRTRIEGESQLQCGDEIHIGFSKLLFIDGDIWNRFTRDVRVKLLRL